MMYTNPMKLVNNYGVFAVMTTQRPELIIEASNDSLEWQAYQLHFKPGPLGRAPGWVTPLQPCLLATLVCGTAPCSTPMAGKPAGTTADGLR